MPSPAIKVESDYFGYIALDLTRAGKGHAYCNACKKMYDSNQLISRPIGFGRTPFGVNLKEKGGIIKRFFSKKKLISGIGGEAYDCPKGQEFRSSKKKTTWIKGIPLRIAQPKALHRTSLPLMLSSCKLEQSFYSKLIHDLAGNTVVGSEGADVVDLLLLRDGKMFEGLGHLEVPGDFRFDRVQIHTRKQRFEIDLLGLNGRG